jgi:hypothetical protein
MQESFKLNLKEMDRQSGGFVMGEGDPSPMRKAFPKVGDVGGDGGLMQSNFLEGRDCDLSGIDHYCKS